MSDLTQLLRQARRRELADTAIRRAGWGLAIGTVAAITALLIQRGFDLRWSWRLFWFGPALGCIGGIIHAWVTQRPLLHTAVNLDRSLRLKDRIGSAHEMSARSALHIDGGFSALLQADAEKLAAAIDVRPATPIRMTGVWGTAMVLCLLLWIGAAYMPALKWRTQAIPDQPTPEMLAQLTPQAQQIAETIEQSTRALPKDDPALDAKARADLAALERLSQQLSQTPGSQQKMDSARDEAAARMNELADRLAEQSERDLSATDELSRKFSGMDSTGAPKPPMSAEEFRDALKRGDFGAAAKELEDLLKKPGELSPQEQQALADHLRDTADRLESESKSDIKDSEARREQFEQSLRDQGFTQEQINKLHELMKDHPASPEDLRHALEQQQNFDPETAEQLSRDLKQMLDERQNDEQVQRDLNDVSRSLDDAADQIEHPEPPPPDEKGESDTTQPAADEQPSQTPASQPHKPPTAPQKPSSQSQTPDHSKPPNSQKESGKNQPKGDQSSDQQKQDQPQTQDSQSGERNESAPSSQKDSRQPQPASQPSERSTSRSSTPDKQQQDQQKQNATSQDQQKQPNIDGEQPSASQPSPSSSPQNQPSQSQPAATPEQKHPEATQGQQQKQSPQKQPDQTKQSNSQEQRDAQPSPDQKGERQPNDQNEPSSEKQGDKQQRQQQPKGMEPQQGKPEQGLQPQPAPGQSPQPQTKPQPGAQQPSGKDGPSPRDPARDLRDQPERVPGESPDEKPQSGEPREPGAVPKDSGESPSPSEAIRRIAERQKSAKDRQQISEDMRRRARELAERMSPEERERWAREWQKQNPTPPTEKQQQNPQPSPSSDDPNNRLAHGGGPDAGDQNGSKDPSAAPPPVDQAQPQTVDLRGNDPGEQMLSDFLEADPNTPLTDGQPRRTSGVDQAERVRRAQEVAERAVNDSAVPSRYHQFIKRVFGNLNKTVPAAGPPATQPGG